MIDKNIIKQIEKDSLYRKKMTLVPSYIIAGLSILSLIIIGIFSDSVIMSGYVVFIYLGLMLLTPLSIIWPGFMFADYMVKKKKEKKENE